MRAVLLLCLASALSAQTTGQARRTVNPNEAPRPVRNNVAQPSDEIVTIRYFKIKKGTFDQFLKASQEDVWPFFDKIGARVIGMWKVMPVEGAKDNPEYDEVYLSTRYASMEHWRATRDMAKLGGNGPDYVKCQQGLAIRDSLTIETHVIFLKGAMKGDLPRFMPGLE